MNTEIQTTTDPDVLTDHGLNLPKDITETEFFEVGTLLGNIEKGMQWAIGDWYNNIPQGYNDKVKACDRAGLNPDTARQCALIADVFELSARSQILPFTHHRVLVSTELTNAQRQSLLQQAEIGEANKKGVMKSWSSRRLEKERDITLGTWVEPTQINEPDSLKNFVTQVSKDIPPKYRRKVERVATKVAAQLAKDFEKQVQKRVHDEVDNERQRFIKMQEETTIERERIEAARRNVNQIMSKKEFSKVRSVLHPDRHHNDPRYSDAFEIFNRLLKTIDSKTYELWNEK